jgi:outer membrane lipoprotein SlyB
MNFRIGFPEAAGLAIVGSTIGALLGGAGSGDFNITATIGALAGAVVPFGAAILPRLSRSEQSWQKSK